MHDFRSLFKPRIPYHEDRLYERNNISLTLIRFSGLEELAYYAETCERPSDWQAMNVSRRAEANGFYGTATFEDAIKLARNGWKEGEVRAKEILCELGPKIREWLPPEGYPPMRAPAGNGSIARVTESLRTTGNPLVCIQHKHLPAKRPLRIVTEISCTYTVGIDVLLRRATILSVLAQAARQAGYPVQLSALDTARFYTAHDVCIRVDIPAAASHARAAFGMGHPSLLRRLFFSVMESKPIADALRLASRDPQRQLDPGYGMPHKLPEHHPWLKGADLVLVSENDAVRDFLDDDSARKWLLKKSEQLAKTGGWRE